MDRLFLFPDPRPKKRTWLGSGPTMDDPAPYDQAART